MSAAVAFAPNCYSRVHLNTASLNYAPPKALVGASLKGYSLHCIIFRTATELACGSGEITIALAERGYTMTASDISQAMLSEAQKKPGSENVTWKTMDMHSRDRLKEFQEEYNEAGRIDYHEYQWTIQTMEDRIYQNFAFYDEAGRAVLEQHVQRVYEPNWVKKELDAIGFEVTIRTDFNQEGIQEGEKLFYICRRVCE